MRKMICPINSNTKAKAKDDFRGVNFALISVSTVVSTHCSPFLSMTLKPSDGGEPYIRKEVKEVATIILQIILKKLVTIFRHVATIFGKLVTLFHL